MVFVITKQQIILFYSISVIQLITIYVSNRNGHHLIIIISHNIFLLMQLEKIGDYQLVKNPKLGSGATGEVFYGQNMKNNYKIAAKQIDTTKINASLAKQIQNEIKNLTKLNSPFIVKLYDYFKCGNYLYLFLEYCEDGDLKSYMDSKKGSGLSQKEALMFMRHIIEGYKQLYKHNIIHRDIKPANILLKQGIAKLSDFGFSRVVDNPDISQKFTLLGTPLYTAIQILTGKDFSSKCDVWSLGVVFYQMLSGKTPWTGKDLVDLKNNINHKQIQFKENCQNPQITKLILSMLKLQSKQRISWQDLFSHKLFQNQISVKQMGAKEKDYQQTKLLFFDYLKNNIVKGYLRLNMSDVNFKESYEPSQSKKKQIVQEISKQITNKRNIAFLYLYVLALYYKNAQIISPGVNKLMEFEYALILKTFKLIYQIGEQYFDKKAPQNINNWQIFKESSNYQELKKILSNDFTVIDTLKKRVKKQAITRYNQKRLPQDTGKYYNSLETAFDKTFQKIMKDTQKQIQKKSNGVSNLIKDYISSYIRNPKKLQQNYNLDFGSFYQTRERMFGLS